ncbi:hypothetical protein [Scytonema sp. UIC 10036]|uniref:hypothetical protein n=1 Tax=Scytonema sp. UIC 10036 TaxID=2304196 RepID=UPI001FAABC8A|nr:hypothetical protein [Scytonema sp. UIC 10036]
MILLDTHVWLWLLHEPNQLSSQAQTIINAEELQNGLLVSAISVWEPGETRPVKQKYN